MNMKIGEERMSEFFDRKVFDLGCSIKRDIEMTVREMAMYYELSNAQTTKVYEKYKKAVKEAAKIYNSVSTFITLNAEEMIWVMKDPVTYREDIVYDGDIYKYQGYSWCGLEDDIMDKDVWNECFKNDDGDTYIP